MTRLTRRILFMASVAVFAAASLIHAEHSVVYRWTDDIGAAHISNRLENAPEKFRASATPMKVINIDTPEPAIPTGSAKLIGDSKVNFDPKKEGVITFSKFNGSVNRNAIVDTGSGWVVITTKLAIALGYDLKTSRKSRFKVFGGSVLAPAVVLSSVQVGPAIVSNVAAAVIDFEGRGPVSAIIGMNFLSRFVFEIDHSKGEVKFTVSPTHKVIE